MQCVTCCVSPATIAGTIPSTWSSAGAFPNLLKLLMYDLSISGTLPAAWGSTAFPSLGELSLQYLQKLSGSLPSEWASTTSFQDLRIFFLIECSITGESF